MPVRAINKSVNVTSYETDCLQILKVVRPQWFEGHDKGKSIQSRVLNGGHTNHVYAFSRTTDERKRVPFFSRLCCRTKDDDMMTDEAVVIKVFGENTDKLIDRKAELEIVELLQKQHCGPELYATFTNGVCFEFLPGTTLTTETCRSPEIFPLLACELARMHASVSLPKGETGTQFWRKIRHFNESYKAIAEENKAIKDRFEVDFKFTWTKAANHIDEMEKIIEKQGIPISVCHNDLVLGNIIYNNALNKVSLIDFEFATPNYIAYDVANHFIEFAGVDDPNFDLCPKGELRRDWISAYLKQYKTQGHGRISFTQDDFERWVDICTPASHLYWALWAAVLANNSNIDFDYAKYAGLRYAQYEKCIPGIREKK